MIYPNPNLQDLDDDRIELEDLPETTVNTSQPEIPAFTVFVLYGVNRHGKSIRLGVFSHTSNAVAHVTHNELPSWSYDYTSLHVMQETMSNGVLELKKTAEWVRSFKLL